MPTFSVTLTSGQVDKLTEIRDDHRARSGDNTLTSQQVAIEILRREWLELKRRQRSGTGYASEITQQQQDGTNWET